MISAKKLSKKFTIDSKVRYVLKDINLELDKGKMGMILGRSGAGKSTLLHLVAGLDIPDTGECWIGDDCISSLDEEQRAEKRLGKIGFVFQTYNFLASLKIRENILIPAILLGKEPLFRTNERIKALSDILGINHILNQMPSEVSGGELQRACIARAMINNPGLIVADEPTGNLDTTNRGIVVESFKKIRDEYDVTVLMVTHDEEIKDHSDHVFHLKDGTLSVIR